MIALATLSGDSKYRLVEAPIRCGKLRHVGRSLLHGLPVPFLILGYAAGEQRVGLGKDLPLTIEPLVPQSSVHAGKQTKVALVLDAETQHAFPSAPRRPRDEGARSRRQTRNLTLVAPDLRASRLSAQTSAVARRTNRPDRGLVQHVGVWGRKRRRAVWEARS